MTRDQLTEPGRDLDRTSNHAPARPSWDCVICGKAWPCDAAREAMTTALAPDRLLVVMFDHYTRAAQELSRTPLPELYTRFVSWARRAA